PIGLRGVRPAHVAGAVERSGVTLREGASSCSASRAGREPDPGERPALRRRVEFDRTAMGLGDPVRDREAEAAALRGEAPGVPPAVESLEDAAPLLRRDPDPRVLDLEDGAVRLGAGAERDTAAGGGVAERIPGQDPKASGD